MPDLKTAMNSALKNTQLKPKPVKFRIWNWLRDHPGKTAEEITKGLGSSYELTNYLSPMVRTGILRYDGDVSNKINPVTGTKYKIRRYYVVNRTEFVDVPLSAGMKPKVTPTVVSIANPDKPQVQQPVRKEFDPEAFMSTVTLAQAKSLYLYLKEVFS